MINTSVSYIVYDHSGGGVRHHHFTSQNNIIGQANGHASPGDTIPALGFASQIFHGANVPFAFMSVHGAADGNHLYTSPGTQSVTVGDNDIAILVVYAPPGGIGSNGGPGVWVDAFNVDTGDFSDSDFIEVLTPPTPPDTIDLGKSQHANAEGDVSTLNAENLRAYQKVDAAPFLEWKKITPAETLISARDIQLSALQTGEIWFAFYQTRKSSVSIPDLSGKLAQSLGRWVNDDYCGTPWPHHIGPSGPNFQINIEREATSKLSAANQKKLDGYIKAYPAVAKAAYAEMGKVQDILHGVSALLSSSRKG